MIDALINALIGSITAETIATMMIFTLVARGAWRIMDIMLDGLDQWMKQQLSNDDDDRT